MLEENDPLVKEGTIINSKPSFQCRPVFYITALVLTLVIVAVIVIVVLEVGKKPADEPNPAYQLSGAVTTEKIMGHLNQLNQIGVANISRSVRIGYNASADYIISQLETYAKCNVSKDYLQVLFSDELATPQLSLISPINVPFLSGSDFRGVRFGGNTRVQNLQGPICTIANDGCLASDFEGIPNGCIPLIPTTSGCSNLVQAMNAELASASAILFYVTTSRALPNLALINSTEYFPGDYLLTIPALVCSYAVNTFIRQYNNTVISLSVSTSIAIATTYNILCETEEGDPDNTLVVGAHLDSVPAGPGLNDNGSGSSSLLEIVIQWYRLGIVPKNRIRFAWWGAEEMGLIGSRHYVRNLSPDQLGQIAMNLNFDMLASPNYRVGVHDGLTGVRVKNESRVITGMFTEFFEAHNIPYTFIPLLSGSDFVPFVEAGIPAGGLIAGASIMKNETEKRVYGGLANVQFDPCYHLACDTINNINQECLSRMSSAAAYVIQKSAEHPNLRDYLSGITTTTDL